MQTQTKRLQLGEVDKQEQKHSWLCLKLFVLLHRRMQGPCLRRCNNTKSFRHSHVFFCSIPPLSFYTLIQILVRMSMAVSHPCCISYLGMIPIPTAFPFFSAFIATSTQTVQGSRRHNTPAPWPPHLFGKQHRGGDSGLDTCSYCKLVLCLISCFHQDLVLLIIVWALWFTHFTVLFLTWHRAILYCQTMNNTV